MMLAETVFQQTAVVIDTLMEELPLKPVKDQRKYYFGSLAFSNRKDIMI